MDTSTAMRSSAERRVGMSAATEVPSHRSRQKKNSCMAKESIPCLSRKFLFQVPAWLCSRRAVGGGKRSALPDAAAEEGGAARQHLLDADDLIRHHVPEHHAQPNPAMHQTAQTYA